MSAFAVLLGLGGMLVLMGGAASSDLPGTVLLAGAPGLFPALLLLGTDVAPELALAGIGLAAMVVALIAWRTSQPRATT